MSSAVLEMPLDFIEVNEAELDEIDGGIAAAAVIGIITGAMAIGAGLYGVGQVAGERAYYAGLRNPAYQGMKWQVRAGAVALAGVVGGPIIMTGFENKFYSMI